MEAINNPSQHQAEFARYLAETGVSHFINSWMAFLHKNRVSDPFSIAAAWIINCHGVMKAKDARIEQLMAEVDLLRSKKAKVDEENVTMRKSISDMALERLNYHSNMLNVMDSMAADKKKLKMSLMDLKKEKKIALRRQPLSSTAKTNQMEKIFINYLKAARRHQLQAMNYIGALKDANQDMKSLGELHSKEGLASFVKTLESVKEVDRVELAEILENFFAGGYFLSPQSPIELFKIPGTPNTAPIDSGDGCLRKKSEKLAAVVEEKKDEKKLQDIINVGTSNFPPLSSNSIPKKHHDCDIGKNSKKSRRKRNAAKNGKENGNKTKKILLSF